MSDETVETSSKCRHCGSEKVIEDALIEDSGEYSHGKLQTLVAYKSPDALLFTGPIRAELRATLCCSCGAVDLRLADPGRLWNEYQKAPHQQRP